VPRLPAGGAGVTASRGGARPIEVRLLGPGDAAVLARIAEDTFDEPPEPALTAEFLADPRHHVAVALADGVVVGFASGVHYVHPDKPAELFVNEVGVSPAHQRRGIGRRVLAALLEHGATLGCVKAWVLTEPENAAARALYAAGGGRQLAAPVMYEFDLESERGARDP
jgi:ribosomal protein S18 acetylase RimI-like enzyme